MKKQKEKTSDFGKGFIYNLILFAKHWAMDGELFREIDELPEKEKKKFKVLTNEKYRAQLWFNGASDHFYELEIPKKFENTPIGKKALELQDKALEIGHGRRLFNFESIEDKAIDKFFTDLEDLAMEIDKSLGLEPIEATWK